MYSPKPINFNITVNRNEGHTWYFVDMQYNGNTYRLKEYSKSKKRAMDFIRKIRTGSYKQIPLIKDLANV